MDKKRYAGVIVKCNNKFLLCERNSLGSFPGMWSIPGGKMNDIEEPISGARREFFEETSVSIDDLELRFVSLMPRYTRDGKRIKGLMYVYLLEVDKEIEPNFETAIDGEEHVGWRYFGLDEITIERVGDYFHKLSEILLNFTGNTTNV